MTPLFPLHNPGCNDPNKLCDPHPIELQPVLTPGFWLVFIGIVAAVITVVIIQRARIRASTRRKDIQLLIVFMAASVGSFVIANWLHPSHPIGVGIFLIFGLINLTGGWLVGSGEFDRLTSMEESA